MPLRVYRSQACRSSRCANASKTPPGSTSRPISRPPLVLAQVPFTLSLSLSLSPFLPCLLLSPPALPVSPSPRPFLSLSPPARFIDQGTSNTQPCTCNAYPVRWFMGQDTRKTYPVRSVQISHLVSSISAPSGIYHHTQSVFPHTLRLPISIPPIPICTQSEFPHTLRVPPSLLPSVLPAPPSLSPPLPPSLSAHIGIGFPTGVSLNQVAAHYTPNPGDKTVLK
jgi:hypothetical protein